jgi:hypothetical protein
MIGQQILSELGRPLEGDRRFVRSQHGDFTLRFNPEHIGETRAEKARLAVEQDVANFRRMLTLHSNLRSFA